MKKKDKRFEELWELEKKIFGVKERSTKKDLKDIYDCRELLIITDFGYAIGTPLEEVPKKEIPKKELINFGKKNTLYIWSIGVIPKFRGKRLGKDLLNKLIAYSPKPRISLDTTSSAMKKLCFELRFKKTSETYYVLKRQPNILTSKK